MTSIALLAPIAGWLTPLEEVPDPVFADRIMGDGIAIDPIEGILRAPADGTIVSVPDSAHAVSLRLANGAELLIHVGLDTVALGGNGFEAHVSAGSAVKAGDKLISFDLDRVGRAAPSLITPIILTSEGFELKVDRPGRLVSLGDAFASITGAVPDQISPALNGTDHVSGEAIIGAANGLHARPAARLVAKLRSFNAQLTIGAGEKTANARSTTSLLALGARHGDRVKVAAEGPDATVALQAAVEFLASDMGDSEVLAPAEIPGAAGAAVCAVPGLAIGTIFQFQSSDRAVERDAADPVDERSKLDTALSRLSSQLEKEGGTLAEAHLAIVSDPELIEEAQKLMARGRSAAFAWRSACASARQAIGGSGDRLIAEREADLLDIERQVIDLLLGDDGSSRVDLPDASILIANDLLPSQFLALDKSRLAGICTAAGGPTSHVAVLSASANIPMLVAAGPSVLEIETGRRAILDAGAARLDVDPDDEQLAQTKARIAEQRAIRQAQAKAAHEPCFTADGVRIEVFANIGSAEDALSAAEAGAEGCGLLRTEFLFLERTRAPDEAEQVAAYRAIAEALGDRPIVIRTLDIGGDKPVPYLPAAHEENPALGCRGIRLSLARPDMLATQLRAILRAIPANRCRIMLPMIVDAAELAQVRQMLEEAAASVGISTLPQLGVMIETPAAAILADTIAAKADFLSIGTNDLTQYALASDRGNPAVSSKVDAFHPAVLRLIRETGRGAQAHGRWLGLCGGLASDPLATSILLGLGVTEFSVTPSMVAPVKAALRSLTVGASKALAETACAASTAKQVREIARSGIL